MAVDDAGQDGPARRVENLGAARDLHRGLGARRLNDAVLYDHDTVFDRVGAGAVDNPSARDRLGHAFLLVMYRLGF